MNTEKSEMLTVYDRNLNPIGERTRADVHADGLLHRTIRLWTVYDGGILFQRRSMDKPLFPGRFDLSATGHVDPGEFPDDAVLRETREEIGIDLKPDDLIHAGDIPFPFVRPDGKLDNEFASIYLYLPVHEPRIRMSDEVAGFAVVGVEDYGKLAETGEPVDVAFYDVSAVDGSLSRAGRRKCGPGDFCCLNTDEWRIVTAELDSRGRGVARESPVKRFGLGEVGEIADRCAGRGADMYGMEY